MAPGSDFQYSPVRFAFQQLITLVRLVFPALATSFSGFSSSLAPVERVSVGCSGHFSSCFNHSGPVNQTPFSILSTDAPLLPRLAMFLSVGQYFQEILSCSVTVAIFQTRFATNTFQLFLGFISQWSATVLSIHMVMETAGHLGRACCTLLAMFAVMCPATSSSLCIVPFLLEILDFEVTSPCTVLVSCLTRAIVTAEQARLLASAKRWRSIDLTSLHCLTRLLGTFTLRTSFQPAFASFSDTTAFHPNFSPPAYL